MGRKKKKEKEGPSGPPGAPEWVVTFTDMISLLVTFFVLLMTFSSLETYDVLKVDSWLEGDKGVVDSKKDSVPLATEDELLTERDLRRGAQAPHSRPTEELHENLEEMGQKLTEEHLELNFSNIADGLVIEFDEKASFRPSSADVVPELEKSLTELGEVLRHYPHLVVIEGYTDDAFRSSPRYSSPESLSFARAEASARVLLAKSGMNPALLQVAGHGAKDPRADNVSAGGRRLNRRVQLRVLALSKMRAGYLLAQEREEEG